ncbi:MAG: fructose-bisphosphatase class I [Halobacteriales archaeon SW_8_66_22]|nr:MAG: fructose-bisphosphatase class I [Halobacteriales archaeon SW_8_66_22]
MAGPIEAVFDVVARTAADARNAFAQRRSYHDQENPSGDEQLAAELYADELLEERLLAVDGIASYASEERENVATADAGREPAYHVTCDPLDGSSNLKSNNGMGAIVGIYDREIPAPGSSIVAAGYVLYGPITTMVTAADGTVSEYLIEDGSRDLLNEDIQLPDDPVVYGFGGRIPDWLPSFGEYVDGVEGERLKLRYGGAMVADINQVLTYGGVFGYPMLEDRPEGKLRLQFEGIPMAKIFADAGGASSDGSRSLLSKTPGRLHERSPVFVGNESLITDLEATVE